LASLLAARGLAALRRYLVLSVTIISNVISLLGLPDRDIHLWRSHGIRNSNSDFPGDKHVLYAVKTQTWKEWNFLLFISLMS
jgi:hypothetical protein